MDQKTKLTELCVHNYQNYSMLGADGVFIQSVYLALDLTKKIGSGRQGL